MRNQRARNRLLEKDMLASALKTYMKHIDLDDSLKISLCYLLCNFIEDYLTNGDKWNSDLAAFINKFNLNINEGKLCVCLNAMKEFLKSRDFSCERKYKVQSYFWGQIKYFSESTLLQPLYESIDAATAKFSEQQPDETKETSSIQTTYQILKISIDTIKKNPFLFVLLALALTGQVAGAAKKYECNNEGECDWQPEDPTASFITPLRTNTYVDSIQKNYHIVQQNIPLNEASVFVLLEEHTSLWHKNLTVDFTSNMGEGVVLFEGIQALNSFPCQLIAYNTDTFQIDLNLRMDSTENSKLKSFGIDPRQTCMGWDDVTLVNKITNDMPSNYLVFNEYLQKVSQNIQPITNLLLDYLDTVKNQSKLIQLFFPPSIDIQKARPLLESLKKSVVDLNSQLKPEIYTFNLKKLKSLIKKAKNNPDPQQITDVLDEVSSQLTNIGSSYFQYYKSTEGQEAVVKLRNKSASQTLDALDLAYNPSNKLHRRPNIYLLMGSNHAVTRRALDGNGDFKDVQPDDPQYEFRKEMNKRPHAILLPKKN